MRAIQCGIPRSGSTFVWQVLADMFGRDQVAKTHPGIDEWYGAHKVLPTFITIRDPMDVVASLWSIREEHQREPIDMDQTIGYCNQQFHALDRWMTHRPIVLRYHEFARQPQSMFDSINHATGRMITPANIDAFMEKYGLEANRQRASLMQTFSQVDADNIHGRHIDTAGIGDWPKRLPEWSHIWAQATLQFHRQKWGYV